MKALLLAALLAQAAQVPASIPVKSGTVISEETDQSVDVLGGLYLNDAAVMNVTAAINSLQGQSAILLEDLNKTTELLAKERADASPTFVKVLIVVGAVLVSGLVAGAVGYGVGQARGH